MILKSIHDVKFYNAGLTEKEVTEFEAFRACPACGSTTEPEVAIYLGTTEQPRAVALVICCNCSHTYYRNPPPEEQLTHFYESVFSLRLKSRKNARPQRRRTRTKAAKTLFDLGVDPASNPRILDFGCGYGGELAGLEQSGFGDLTGFEPGAARVDRASAFSGARIVQGSWQDIPNDETFDVIFSNHVFEHVRDPGSIFEGLIPHLRPNGVILINVPDSERESPIVKLLFLPHLHSFSHLSMAALGSRFGFRCVYWTGGRHDEICAVFQQDSAALEPLVDRGIVYLPSRVDKGHLIKRLLDEARGPWTSELPTGHVQWDRELGADQGPQDSWQAVSRAQLLGLRALYFLERGILSIGWMHLYFFIARGLRVLSGSRDRLRSTSHLSYQSGEKSGNEIILCDRSGALPLLIK